MKRILILLSVAFFAFTACKKEDAPLTDDEKARDVLYGIMNESYLWYDVMPSVNVEDYSNPTELLDAMRYKELDRWSFVEGYNEFNAYYAGSFVGHGFRIGVDEAGKARIVFIYANSPLYSEGVRRGWIVKTINNYDIASILIAGNAAAYNTALGASSTSVTNTFVFIEPDGTEKTVSSTKASFTVNSVLLCDTLHLKSGITGHLVFESFIEPSEQELSTAFAYFKQNNITDLILDLRYNGGGMLNIAQILGSYIVGNSKTGSTFVKMQYNDKNQASNTTYKFITTASPMSLTRIAVITSRGTASASEAVINGLKPYMQVVTIGDTTDGKPTGMNIWYYQNTYVFAPVTFKNVNSANEGNFFNGFEPAKLVNDDITHDFDNRRELCLKEAITYLETGFVSTKGLNIFRKSTQFSEKPEWQNNLFVNYNTIIR
jgi:carboxyl-terminal processing protease